MICKAGIAQLVEQLLRKQLVGGSSPLSGTKTQRTHNHQLCTKSMSNIGKHF